MSSLKLKSWSFFNLKKCLAEIKSCSGNTSLSSKKKKYGCKKILRKISLFFELERGRSPSKLFQKVNRYAFHLWVICFVLVLAHFLQIRSRRSHNRKHRCRFILALLLSVVQLKIQFYLEIVQINMFEHCLVMRCNQITQIFNYSYLYVFEQCLLYKLLHCTVRIINPLLKIRYKTREQTTFCDRIAMYAFIIEQWAWP